MNSTSSDITKKETASIPSQRLRNFKQSMAQWVRDLSAQGISPETCFQQAHLEQQALMGALADPRFEQAFVEAFSLAMSARAPHPDDRLPPSDAQRCVRGIIANRVHDLRIFAALLLQPDFRASTLALANSQVSLILPDSLPPEKVEEIIDRATQVYDPRGPEPAIHVMAANLGHRMVHDALATIFRPNGAMYQPLVDALARQLPNASSEAHASIAAAWLAARERPAAAIVEGLKANGIMYRESMNRAEQLQHQRLGLAGYRARLHRDRSQTAAVEV